MTDWGFDIIASDFVKEGTILVVGKPPPIEAPAFKAEALTDPVLSYRVKMDFALRGSTREVLSRPSWLHPLRRTRWVHEHGPGVRELMPSDGAHRIIKRPSWLHPYRRVMWVHRFGPRYPDYRLIVKAPRSMRRSMGVIKNI